MAVRMLAGVAMALLASASAQAAPRDPLAPTGRWSANTDGRAPTPPMGWNSWNAFATDVDEEKVLASAQKIVDTGLAAKGYRYINLDEGWWDHRRADGRMLVRADKFPSARTADGATSFKPFTDRLHAMGLKAGIYTDLGRNTCAQAYGPGEPNLPRGSVLEREVGLYGHIDQDIALYFGEWGFDYIKIDGCGLRAYGEDSPLVRAGRHRALAPLLDLDSINRSNIPAVRAMFAQIKAALIRADPDGDYLLSLCIWGSADVRAWAKDVGNISRTSDDITPHWTRLLTNFDTAARRPLYAHPGSWNDPDMLFIGKGEFDADHLTEARSHFALWAMVSAPLLIGADLRTTPQTLMDIFGNAALIAIDQDPAGNPAVLAFDSDDFQILVKTLADGDKAVALVNRTAAPMEAVLTAQHLKLRDDAAITLTDLWNGTTSRFQKETRFKLAGHETLVFRAQGTRLLADGFYLSELPGIVNPAVDGVPAPMADPSIHRAVVAWTGTRGAGQRPLYAGWGGAQADATPYGRELAVAGRHFTAGLGVLANSRLEVRNPGYRRLTLSAGIDDSAADAAHGVTFQVYGDRRLLATRTVQRRGGAAVPMAVDVTGVKIVELVARAPAAPNDRLPVTWGDAAYHR